ncbi:MAG TPA: OB-fold domain-containing protein [Acidimicrobiales bacterium]
MTDQGAAARPVPRPDELTAPFWEAAADHRLVMPRCSSCLQLAMPPDIVCDACGSTDPQWEWVEVSGRGVLRSWTIARQVFLPGFDEPPVIIDVELDEQPGLRLVSRLVDGPEVAADLVVGVAVQVAFDDVTSGIALPVFELDRST